MSTIVKTGVILTKNNEPVIGYLASYWNVTPGGMERIPNLSTIYGDLHVVGNCCVLYYPETQVQWGTSHGWIDLDDQFQRNFQKDTEPYRILIIPANRVRLRRDALHPFDLVKFQEAGGQIDTSRGELG